MIVIAGSVPVKPEAKDALLGVASSMAAESRAEEGCLEYRFAADIDDPNTIRLFECWEDAASLDRHFKAPHYAEFNAAIVDALAGMPDLTRYEVTGSAPLFG